MDQIGRDWVEWKEEKGGEENLEAADEERKRRRGMRRRAEPRRAGKGPASRVASGQALGSVQMD